MGVPIIRIADRTLAITRERDAYAQLRRKYVEEAQVARDDFLAGFSRAFADADELFCGFPGVLEQVVTDATEAALADIASHQIYDVDELAFGARFAKHLAGQDNPFDRLNDAYQEIVLSAAELEAYREEKAANRGGVVGGGFGAEGAAAGIAIAAVANAALGFIGGVADKAGQALAAVGDRQKKGALYADPATRDGLADVVFETFALAHLAVAEIVNERRKAPVFEPVSASDEAKARALLSNVLKERVPAEATADILFEALSLNPFVDDVWYEWLCRFGDADCSLAGAADQMGITGLAAHKQKLIAQELSGLPKDTPEACATRIAHLEAVEAFFGASTEAEREAVRERAEKLDVARRSFREKTYATQGEAEKARAEWQEREQRTFAGVEYMSQEEADEARVQAESEKAIARTRLRRWVVWGFFALLSIGTVGRGLEEGPNPSIPSIAIWLAGTSLGVAALLTFPAVLQRLPKDLPKFAWVVAVVAWYSFASLFPN